MTSSCRVLKRLLDFEINADVAILHITSPSVWNFTTQKAGVIWTTSACGVKFDAFSEQKALFKWNSLYNVIAYCKFGNNFGRFGHNLKFLSKTVMRIKNHNIYYCKHAKLHRLTFHSPLIDSNRMRLSRNGLIQFREYNQTCLSMC